MINRKLKAAAVLEFGSQVEAARAMGLSEPRFSRLINGRVAPKPEEAAIIRAKLGVDIATEINVGRARS